MDAKKYMSFALELAEEARGQTSPNPLVGAVVVNDGKIVGFGAHLKAGTAHAEVHALAMAGTDAFGATIYVTLEPCSHHGRTSPCADLIIKQGITHAVIACLDPHEKVAGQGIEKLRAAGIEVTLGVLREEAEILNKEFFHYIQTKKPYITLKSATSLDGKTATVTGESKWITGEEARLDVHHYRDQHDAILVGVNTVIADDPSLTTRLANGGKNPIRIILDTSLRTPKDAVVVTDQAVETWIFTGCHVEESKLTFFKSLPKVRVFVLASDEIKLASVLEVLGKEEIMSLFVEGGAEVNGSFLVSKYVNQVITYIAPKLIGGSNAPTAIGGSGFQKMTDILELEIQSVKQIGADIKIVSTPLKEDTDVHRDC